MTLAVVPIFVNAGAALLPAIIAALTSLVALLLSPRAMLSLCRRKPWLPALVILLTVGVYYSPRLFPSTTPPTISTNNAPDWPAIARELIRQQQSPHSLLTLLWRHDLGGYLPLSTPALVTDANTGHTTLYLPATFLDLGKKFGALYAIDTATGQTLWTATKSLSENATNDPFDPAPDLQPFFSSPAISADGAFLAVGQGLHDDANCPLLCFNLNSPNQLRVAWSVKTPLHVESSPAIFTKNGRQMVVVGAGAIEGSDRRPMGNPGYVLCADLMTGKQLWQFPLYDPESSPAIDDDGTIYIGSGFNGNAVVALRSDPDDALGGSSRQLWRTATPFPAVGDVTLASHLELGKILLIGVGNGDYVFSDPKPAGLVLALDRGTGKILWETALPDSVLGRPKVSPDNLLVLVSCRDGEAYALDLASGKILWHTLVSQTRHTPVLAGLAADDSRAYALAADGTLTVMSLWDGQLLDRVKLADERKSPMNLTLSTPVIRDNVLYVGTETMGLEAFRIER